LVFNELVGLMQSSVDPTLPLKSDASIEMVKLMKPSAIPILTLGSDVSTSHVFFISSSKPFEKGGIPLT